MEKLLIGIMGCLIAIQTYSQTERKASCYLGFHGNQVLYDRVMHNSRGVGPELEIFINTKSNFKPKMELFLDNFKTTLKKRLNPEGKELVSKTNVPCVFVGASYLPIRNLYITFSGGICFIRSDIYLGIKPGIGIYFDKNQRFTLKLALTNVFQRDEASKEPFGYMNLGLGIKLF